MSTYNKVVGIDELTLSDEYKDPSISLKIDTDEIKGYDSSGEPASRLGYSLHVDGEPKTIQQVYNIQSRSFTRDEMLDTAENLVGLGKGDQTNDEVLVNLRKAIREFKAGNLGAVDFDNVLKIAVNKYGSQTYKFTSKHRLLLHLGGIDKNP